MMHNDKYDSTRLLSLAIGAALKAGAVIMDIYREHAFIVENKTDNSPVTTADLRADDIISSFLDESSLPQLSEEGIDIPYGERKVWKRFWLIDPLDGTKEFINGTGDFTVNIALIEDQNPLAGVVYAPVSDILYAGLVGYGAWRLDRASELNTSVTAQKIEGFLCSQESRDKSETSGWELASGADYWTEIGVSLPCTSKQGYGIVASLSHLDQRTSCFIKEFNRRFIDTRIVNRGSSLKLCMVAEGSADIYPRFSNISEWDTAAGHAILLASGGYIVQAANTSMPVLYNKPDSLNPWFIAFRSRKLLEAVKGMIPRAET